MNRTTLVQKRQINVCLLVFFLIPSLFLAVTLPLTAQIYQPNHPEFYNAQGFGFDTNGGFGGEIVIVNNLNASGSGSLADAVNRSGPRIIVFEVGGVIDLKGATLRISSPFVTIAGNTAPDPGITLIQGGIEIATHDVIIQHIRIRPGEAGYTKNSGWEVDGLSTGKGAYNVIIDHCSFSWATDENLSASGPAFDGNSPEEWRQNTSHQILFSYNLITEALNYSTHSKGQHSMGSLVHDNVTGIAIARNVYASNVGRNPLFKGGSQGVIINNFIYNAVNDAIYYNLVPSEWGTRALISGKLSVVGNFIEFGPNTPSSLTMGRFNGPCELYWTNNIGVRPDYQAVVEISGSPTLMSQTPVWPEGIVVLAASQTKDHLLVESGARPWNRDAIDQRIIQEIKNGQGAIINSEQEVGGYPNEASTFKAFNLADWPYLTGSDTGGGDTGGGDTGGGNGNAKGHDKPDNPNKPDHAGGKKNN